MAFTIRWSDGGTDTAATAALLLQELAAQQMNPDDRANIKAALAWRAKQALDAKVDVTLPDEEFVRACSMVGLFELTDSSNAPA